MLFVSRSFAPTGAIAELEEIVATYAVEVAEKLRRSQQTASHVSLFISTNPFDQAAPQHAQSAAAVLPIATSFSPDVIDLSLALLRTLYRPGHPYKRAGVGLTQLHPEAVVQADLFGLFSHEVSQRQQRIMRVLDEVNWQWGPHTLIYAAQGTRKPWALKQTRRSPRYTTKWEEILSLVE